MKKAFIILSTALLLRAAAGVAGEGGHKVWLGPEGQPLPFDSDAQVLDFLETAPVASMERVGKGITNPHKVLLERGSIRMHAIFRDVRSQRQKSRIRGAVRWNFRDDYIFECAAYHLSVLLGLGNVPPAVPRTINGKSGSLQLWIEKAFTEEERKDQGLTAPDQIHWARQRQIRHLFDQLINNEDRNQGNLLIDSNWKLWLIDHTRAFHPLVQLWDPKRIVTCERTLWGRLQNLDRDQVHQRLEPFLRSNELRALFKRWDRLVAHISGLIEERGQEFVLFDIKQKEAGGRRQETGRMGLGKGYIWGKRPRFARQFHSPSSRGSCGFQGDPANCRFPVPFPSSCLLPPASCLLLRTDN